MKIKSKPKETNTRSILIAAAGTGGHIMPAMAVADKLINKKFNLFWAGTPNGMENRIVDKKKIFFISLAIGGFRGKKIISLISYPFKFLLCLMKVMWLIQKYKISRVLVFGGYISLPVGFAAKLMRKKLFIHEQNTIMGTSNKLLAPFAEKIFSAFPLKINQSVNVCGNPIRGKIANINKTINQGKNKINILILGGSLGAQVINEKIPIILNKLKKYDVVHQCGKGKKSTLEKLYDKKNNVIEFIDNIEKYYKWADLVIARSGAMTVAELEQVGLPAIFIPFPFAIDNHQQKNAEYCVDKGGALICKQDEIDSQLESMLNKISLNECLKMSKAMKSLRHKNAVKEIYNKIK
tara:strand:- start:20278 stop:21330 length:1053 start_codon:yes stop_codon:yes gene_type:complete